MLTAKRNKLNGLINIEAAVEKLRISTGGTYTGVPVCVVNLCIQPYHADSGGLWLAMWVGEGGISEAVADLVFTPPEGLQLLQRFLSVIFMNSTYKTSKVGIGSPNPTIAGSTDLDRRSSPSSRSLVANWAQRT